MKQDAKSKVEASVANGGERETSPISDWQETQDAVPGQFPGPSHADVPLRVAFAREAYADLIHHARSSLEAEICGVLVGRVMRDEEGVFVHARAIIRGEAARRGSAHVTFTQETWNRIHAILEKDFADLHIVGWYHTHPGFGVTFSDMDLFIQKHFFPLRTQIALVTDPLSGETAISINTSEGPCNLPRFWVDGREVRCHAGSGASGTSQTASPVPLKEYQDLETRISQFMRNEDDRRRRFYGALTFIGMMVLSFLIVGVGYLLYQAYTATGPQAEVPKIRDFGNIPITFEMDGKTIVLNIQVQGLLIAPGQNGAEQVPTVRPQSPGPGDQVPAAGIEK